MSGVRSCSCCSFSGLTVLAFESLDLDLKMSMAFYGHSLVAQRSADTPAISCCDADRQLLNGVIILILLLSLENMS